MLEKAHCQKESFFGNIWIWQYLNIAYMAIFESRMFTCVFDNSESDIATLSGLDLLQFARLFYPTKKWCLRNEGASDEYVTLILSQGFLILSSTLVRRPI